MPAYPSPCLDVCKYKLRGHCIACGMTRMQKRMAEGLRDPEAQKRFIADLMVQQGKEGSSKTWPADYARKCVRHGLAPPFVQDG